MTARLRRPQHSKTWPAWVDVITQQHPAVIAAMQGNGELRGDASFTMPAMRMPAGIAQMLLRAHVPGHTGGHPVWCHIDDQTPLCDSSCGDGLPACDEMHVAPGLVAVRATIPVWSGVFVESEMWTTFAVKCLPPPGTEEARLLVAEVIGSGQDVVPSVTTWKPEQQQRAALLMAQNFPVSPEAGEDPGVLWEMIVESISADHVVELVPGPAHGDRDAWYEHWAERDRDPDHVRAEHDWSNERDAHIGTVQAGIPAQEPTAAEQAMLEVLAAVDVNVGWSATDGSQFRAAADRHVFDGSVDVQPELSFESYADAAAALALTISARVSPQEVLIEADELMYTDLTTAAALLDAPGADNIERLQWVRTHLDAEFVVVAGLVLSQSAAVVAPHPARAYRRNLRAAEQLLLDAANRSQS